jgi:hypothetical protein
VFFCGLHHLVVITTVGGVASLAESPLYYSLKKKTKNKEIAKGVRFHNKRVPIRR